MTSQRITPHSAALIFEQIPWAAVKRSSVMLRHYQCPLIMGYFWNEVD